MTIAHFNRVAVAVALAFGFTGCTGSEGPEGPQGPQGESGQGDQGDQGEPGTSCTVTDNGDGTKTISCEDGTSAVVSDGASGVVTATLAGSVKNKLTSEPVAGATVTLSPAIQGLTIIADAQGAFSATLPVGTYALTYAAPSYKSASDTVSLVAGASVTKSVTLVPTANVAVTVTSDAPAEAAYGASVTATANVLSLDNTTPTAYEWSVQRGPALTLATPTAASTGVTLATLAAYKAHLFELLEKPDRLAVAGVNPMAIEEATATVLQVKVTMSNGKVYTGTGTVHVTPIDIGFTTGVQNIPTAVPALLHAPTKDGSGTAYTYSWHVVSQVPGGVAPTFDSTTDQNVIFTPNDEGKYILAFDAGATKTLTVYAGKWIGAIGGPDKADGRPNVDACKGCHQATSAPTAEFDAWRLTGHAEILEDNLNTSTHYSTECLTCHTVGYDEAADNGGIDDQSTWDAFLADFTDGAGAFHADPTAWATTTTAYSAVAKLGNIQCENCHGPNSTIMPTDPDSPHIAKERVSLDAAVCGSCHGEPPRHGRFQQWQESGHGNYETAISESSAESNGASYGSTGGRSGASSCGRCHSAQGFLAWIEQDDLSKCLGSTSGTCAPASTNEADSINANLIAMGMDNDHTEPVTCVTCHDPHDIGTVSGDSNNARLRISGTTKMLPSGFRAVGLGKGALCITCHNSRNGAHNDLATFDTANYDRAPHAAAQGDVFMGENAYFVDVGQRSAHANIADSCSNCHLQKSPPPADYSMNLAATNHAFAADPDVCAECHGESFEAAQVAEGFEMGMEDLAAAMGTQVIAKLGYVVDPDKDGTAEASFRISSAYYVQNDETVYSKSNAFTVDQVPQAVKFTESSGRYAFQLTFATAISVPYKDASNAVVNVSTKDVWVQMGNVQLTTTGNPKIFDATYVTLAKAMWNYFLLHGDASEGVHNPSFGYDVIAATVSKLETDYECATTDATRCNGPRPETCQGIWTYDATGTCP